MARDPIESYPGGWRSRLYTVIFGFETAGGKLFDIALLWLIFASVVVVMIESITSITSVPRYNFTLEVVEWFLTAFFAVEYILRLISLKKPSSYIFSYFGLIDLIAILPSLLSLIIPGAEGLLTIRALRLLRVFRVLKLVGFLKEADALSGAMKASVRKILVFLGAVVIVVTIVGAMMYVIEFGQDSGFTSIPQSVYWAIVTMTTVGYGDIAPVTILGRTLASVLMIVGYGVIAVPTGIISAEMVKPPKGKFDCDFCRLGRHDLDARHCKGCGKALRHEL